jgi:hypothetical protein
MAAGNDWTCVVTRGGPAIDSDPIHVELIEAAAKLSSSLFPSLLPDPSDSISLHMTDMRSKTSVLYTAAGDGEQTLSGYCFARHRAGDAHIV